MRTWIAISLLVPTVAAADVYDAHMRAGDALEAKAKWTDALAEFEAALAAKPNDAHALVEVGWTAYNAKKLPRAREASEAAVLAAASDPQLRGAALFNLGLAYAGDDAYAAASLVFAGYVLRPNASVEAELVKLEKGLKAKTASPAGRKLLDKLHVADVPKPSRDGTYHAPVDDALVVTLQGAGAVFSGVGMMKEELTVSKIACTESKNAYSCTLSYPNLKDSTVTGDAARAVVMNLTMRKLKGKDDGKHVVHYDTGLQCRLYDEMDQGSDMSCSLR
jgi:tetratricopeptide (TPR) repeat protein